MGWDENINKTDLSTIGNLIKYYRQEKKLSQKELADLIGKELLDVQNYEANITEPTDEILTKISDVLDLDEKKFIALNHMLKAVSELQKLSDVARTFNSDSDKNTAELFFILKIFLNYQDEEKKQEFLYVIDKYNSLNEKGKQKLIEYITDLSEQSKYSESPK